MGLVLKLMLLSQFSLIAINFYIFLTRVFM